MPYIRPPFLFHAHLETIYPALFRQVNNVTYTRERIATPDQDFLDIDWIKQGCEKVIILSHGLEGNTQRAYIKGMAKAFALNGLDVLTWNFRGCSEEMNHQLRFYHSGATDDLDWIVQHARTVGYKQIYLGGFSLGGNLTLKYLGERNPYSELKGAVAFSVPLNLHTSCLKISQPANRVYAQRFLKSLKEKIKMKAAVQSALDIQHIDRIKTLLEFDDAYTAPLHGFGHAVDYYTKCSSISFLKNITLPTLLINAANDPFLSPECYPVEALRDHPAITFETPPFGGHVGFAQFSKNGLYWSEERAVEFLTKQ